ncbi:MULTISPECIES: hypothetical protein [Serratia]|uniref:hypothetical protein n=1 Tax=Serratia TaxID=613 RepID=UPI0004E78238|nr:MULTISPECIES: hypothetical protein [Serratia]KFF90289.1 hypothetical protein JL05_19995 [Serratia nematodiphila DZ0503SBS1]MDV5742965.1 hypothetical protein [Serratia marcescens]MDV5747876.1 hypothetical protein [Serratia marcescens]MDV5779313.1 hypothetical protein [Serratia marcescens]MDV5784255.1 hypothetical protein [Serratia marcescens]
MAALRNPKILIIGFLAVILFIILLRVLTPAAPVYINCQAETIAKKRLASGDDLELKMTGSLFIYDEHHAMIAQRGDITLEGKTYKLDRKINFDIKRLDHGFYMTTHREISKDPDDNAPHELIKEIPMLSLLIKNGVFSMRKVRQDAYIVHGVLFPITICHSRML